MDDYEKLLDAGFSRCGTYFYHRDYRRSCCESFQYRTLAKEFQPSESQRKALRKFHRYLNEGSVKKAEKEEVKDTMMKNAAKLTKKLSVIEDTPSKVTLDAI